MGQKAPVVQARGAQGTETLRCPHGTWTAILGDQEAEL